MQWGQIKLLFILSFLVLDLFLLQQFLSKQAENELGQISTAAEDTETELEENDITIADDAIPENLPAASEIESVDSTFSEEILSQIEGMDQEGQDIEVEDNRVLKVTLEDPIDVTEDTIQDEVSDLVPFASQYSYWGWNEEEGAVLFFQASDNQTVYFNDGGYLLVNIENGQITGYVATLLSFDDESSLSGSSDTELEPLSAITTLYDYGLISSGDEVTSMSIGYHTSANLAPGEENGPQVFASTWKVTVNGEKNLFLYALYGTVIEINEESFINTIQSSYDLEFVDETSEDANTDSNSETN